jgi:hypothetical protein
VAEKTKRDEGTPRLNQQAVALIAVIVSGFVATMVGYVATQDANALVAFLAILIQSVNLVSTKDKFTAGLVTTLINIGVAVAVVITGRVDVILVMLIPVAIMRWLE